MPAVILEKRLFPRVSLAASGSFRYRKGSYRVRLENISLAGALITFEEGDSPFLSRGERCTLALNPGMDGAGLQLSSRVVHFGFDMACVRFVNLDLNSMLMLRSITAQAPGFPNRAKRSQQSG